MNYTNRVVIITGGSKGIGKCCVQVFVAAGAKVVFCARKEAESQALALELNGRGPGEATFIQCEVAKSEEVKNLIDSTITKHGRLDCLINNAGWQPPHQADYADYTDN